MTKADMMIKIIASPIIELVIIRNYIHFNFLDSIILHKGKKDLLLNCNKFSCVFCQVTTQVT